MRKLLWVLAFTGAAVSGRPALAEIGTIDAVPAATLLLPYFEVDLSNPSGVTTLFSINNASAAAVLAHVTLWTDESIPTLNFDVYLTGYDVQTINLRDVFNGSLPRTADDGEDSLVSTGDTISPQGPLSQDINFPPSGGSLAGPCDAPYANPALSAALIDHIRAAHRGQFSSVLNGCAGHDYGDSIARGYVTVDTVSQCNISFPSDSGYFGGGLATDQNFLWGDHFYVDPANDFAQGDVLVHVESCGTLVVGNGAGHCPFAGGDYTFYGRYASVAGQDQREPLAITFVSRFLNGGAFTGGTDFLVWRDAKTLPTGGNGVHACGANPGWFPLGQGDLVAFDEAENATDVCDTSTVCVPLAAARMSTQGAPYPFGWAYANLNHGVASATLPAGVAQAWVTAVMDADGRFSVGFRAIALDSALTATSGGVVLIP